MRLYTKVRPGARYFSSLEVELLEDPFAEEKCKKNLTKKFLLNRELWLVWAKAKRR